jgi:hypothetical protein
MRSQAEFRLHCVIADYLRLQCRPEVWWTHIANGENRSKITGARLKRMGVAPGAPDILFVFPYSRCAFLEIKAGRGRPSENQKAVFDHFYKWRVDYAVVRSLDEAKAVLEQWGALKQARAA